MLPLPKGPSPSDAQEEKTIVGRIHRVVFQREGFLIAALEDGTVILGDMTSPSMTVEYEFEGKWKSNARYGEQFAFNAYHSRLPKDPGAVAAYIRENAKWVGPATARAIADLYGDDALAICKTDPERVAREVRGITLERAREISDGLRAAEADEELHIELKKLFLGIPVQKRAIKSMIEMWGSDAPAVIKKDPYILPDAITGIGFTTADLIGQRLGIKQDDERRVRGAIMHSLKEAASGSGHTCLPFRELLDVVTGMIACKHDVVRKMVATCVSRGQLVVEADHIYLPKMYADEKYVVEKLTRLALAPQEPVSLALTGLAEDQAAAVRACLGASVSVLTGPAGSGKSFAIKRVIDSLVSEEVSSGSPADPDGHGKKVALAAPTGKAAKRMFEHTNYVAQTIHKLLEPRPTTGKGGKIAFHFGYNEETPLDVSTLVLDETSMLDLPLFASVLRALKIGTRLVMIGDVNQLPAVGAGNILHDLIRSGVISVSALMTIKRQNPGLLLRNAHAVKDGKQITIENEKPDGDFYFLLKSSKQTIQDEICDLVETRLPAKYGYDNTRDIQVLSPFREKTILSCKALNAALQSRLNAKGAVVGKTIFRIGDKVIQKRNDYALGIVNGDIGIVTDVAEVKNKGSFIVVVFDSPERTVQIPMYDNNLQMAYAITCHSYQGSESPAVIIPIHTSFGSLIMQRSWLYTAITRAKSLCVVIGELKAFRSAVGRNQQFKRFTRLDELLKAEMAKASNQEGTTRA